MSLSDKAERVVAILKEVEVLASDVIRVAKRAGELVDELKEIKDEDSGNDEDRGVG